MRNKAEKTTSTTDIPDLHAISLAQLVWASPGMRRLWTTTCKIMHGNRCKRRHVENHLNNFSQTNGYLHFL
jgi:hypothetical protein